MKSFNLVLLAGLLVGCKGDDQKVNDTGASEDTSGSNEDGCGITIASTYPALDQQNMYYRDAVNVELSDEDPTANLALQDADGVEVAGSFAMDGDTLTYTPDAFFAGSTNYTAILTYCGSEDPVNIDFKTDSLGEVVPGGVTDLVEKTYVMDLATGNFVNPAGVGDLIGSMLTNKILLSVTGGTDTEISLRGAISESGGDAQDYCNPSLETFPDADFTNNPYFEINASDGINLDVSDVSISIDSLFISGTFAADGSYFGGGELKGELDARTLAPMLEDLIGSSDPDEVCALLIGFGISCEDCGSDGETYCVNLEVNQLTAEATDSGLDQVCEESCHVSCSANAETCDTPQALEEECPAE